MPSNCLRKDKIHVGAIMDGNGRWAQARGLPRREGHRAGIESLRNIVKAAPDLGIGTLTVHAFSADNWKRPAEEVADLLMLFRQYLDSETETLVIDGVKLNFIGRRDRLPPDLVAEMERAEAATEWGDALNLRVGLDYSARAAIVEAVKANTVPGPDVDLLIRTSGEQRLSDFLLWECAYAEFLFSEKLWPDFGPDDLAEAVRTFHTRERRFGALPEAAE
ncbi:polyprenyl diphosphate synthase [Rhizomicrobium electricum]|uniref:Isoprenyl transferase n=1 Tax=Rhizomicrobium electricum TaxID=480070 RepID=A0ABN1E5V0_9PROT|nr:polyprenyl diphosphate synthase [Rhizomicrobium electricum]NIJ47730.1 undecaprenyl diphosphate synthase [Rhizomicrobium electricum]